MKHIILSFFLAVSASLSIAQEWRDVSITVYNPTASQCDGSPLITACNSRIDTTKLKQGKLRWIAVSRDLLEEFPYGTSVYLWIAPNHPKNGSYRVKDTMNKRYTNAIDILTYNEKRGKWKGKLQRNP
ncbi:MAG: hypothetical protein MJZ30_11575 [Paludibacteraceae bacterium]|nr:hypothetical protein [Paludibacteraceae bacterium]